MASGGSSRATELREALQPRLWPVATAGVLLAFGLGVLLPEVDARVAQE